MAETYVDNDGREWPVRELTEHDRFAFRPAGLPLVSRSTLVFERDDERRTADDAPLTWRDSADSLAQQLARPRRLPYA
jgi:hypothetical protein